MTVQLPMAKVKQAVDALNRHHTAAAAARALGISRSTLNSRIEVAGRLYSLKPEPKTQASVDGKEPEPEVQTFEVSENSKGDKKVWSVSDSVRTVAEALEKAEIDTAIWEVKESTVNSYQVPMKLHPGQDEKGNRGADVPHTITIWQVKVVVRRKAAKWLTDGLELIHQRAAKFAPKYEFPKLPKRKGDLLYVLCLYDHHFGKLCWAEETGSNYDLKIAEAIWDNAAADLLAYVDHLKIERVLLPIGQDFFNFDNISGTTTAGTPQDNDGRYAKVFDTGAAAMVRLIDHLAMLAEVELLYSPGNHDLLASWHLARELEQRYRHTDRVTVDTKFCVRKYVRWGRNLLGLAHAENVPSKWDRLPTSMATESSEHWSQTSHHEWLLGHPHTKEKRETLPMREHDGVIVRTLASLSGTDRWHHGKAYMSKRAAEAYLYSKSKGYVGHFSVNARE